jgi:hypothetical protein
VIDRTKMKKSKKIKISIIVLSVLLTICILWIILNPFKITKDISREYKSECERKLIEIAENIPPPDGMWYYDEFDGIKIADCVNKDAIDYYSKLIDSIKSNRKYTGISLKKAWFVYHAIIKQIKNNSIYKTPSKKLIEVDLHISFEVYFGSQCAFWYSHDRRMIFNENSEIIKVLGDDEKEVILAS